jgi:hypothetical protein
MCHFAWHYNWRSVHERERNTRSLRLKWEALRSVKTDVEENVLLLDWCFGYILHENSLFPRTNRYL